MRVRSAIAIAGVLLSLGCASSKGTSAKAGQEMGFGLKAAEHGYWQEALFRFERARKLKPDDAEILNNLAVAQEALGHYDDALATYKDALKRAPSNSTIRRNYARFAEFFTSYARGAKPKEVTDALH
jgi:Flp pilus assembly protein TadD